MLQPERVATFGILKVVYVTSSNNGTQFYNSVQAFVRSYNHSYTWTIPLDKSLLLSNC